MSLQASWDLASEANPECLGAVWGLVGKLRLHPGLGEHLVSVPASHWLGVSDWLRVITLHVDWSLIC